MKSQASILLISLFLIRCMSPGIDLSCEFEKLPNLIEHYTKHRAAGNESVIEFLVEHFINDSGGRQEKSDPEHEDLPFHGFHQCCHAPVFYSQEVSFVASTSPAHEVQQVGFVNSLHSTATLESPFQPPQV